MTSKNRFSIELSISEICQLGGFESFYIQFYSRFACTLNYFQRALKIELLIHEIDSWRAFKELTNNAHVAVLLRRWNYFQKDRKIEASIYKTGQLESFERTGRQAVKFKNCVENL